MKCPRCLDPVLHETVRADVHIDVCPRCRGLWLDRGELERLQAREFELQAAASRGAVTTGYRDDLHDDDRDDDDDRWRRGAAAGPDRRRRGSRNLFELFD